MNSTPPLDLNGLAQLADRLANAAATETLRRFRDPALSTDDKDKGEGFDPVTAADQAAEAAMRAVLATERPDDGILGEEEAQTHGTSGLTWVLDPIDGTRAFILGLPVWGTLIALDDGQTGRVGIIDQPFLGERYCGIWDGTSSRAWLHRGGTEQPLVTRKGVELAEAGCFTTDPFLFQGPEWSVFERLRTGVRLMRYGIDCYAYGLLALGHVDLVVETGLQAYDIAAHIPIIRAAGGVVTNWQGGDCRWGGQVVAAGSEALHAEALELLNSA
ncbi:MAG: histidinol-phosphatase [Pseudomonadota bacterium]